MVMVLIMTESFMLTLDFARSEFGGPDHIRSFYWCLKCGAPLDLASDSDLLASAGYITEEWMGETLAIVSILA
eukprot:scaffold9314_cov99-Skeletonema_dohrnii-CCMP3373.AAC.5